MAAADDELAEKYLEAGTLSEEELARGLKAAFVKGQLVPVLAGNPLANVGSRVLLDVVRAIFPSPLDRPAIKGYRDPSRGQPVERAPDPDGPLVAQVFRTYYDPFAGMLTYVRIFSGKIHAATDLFNSTENTSDRPSHMYLPEGGVKTGAEIKDATVGDVVVLTKLKLTGTGDTLTTKDDPTFLPPFEEPEALLTFGISAADKKIEEKMASLISKLVEEDPSLRFARDSESKETILGGLGQPHVNYVIERLKRQQIEVELREPKVPYRETLRTAVREIEGKQKKQTGGSGQFAVCFINVEPLPRGSGIVFEDEIVGGAIPRNFIPSVEKGVRDALKRGPLSGNEVVNLKIGLYDGKYHRVNSSDMAFQIAGAQGHPRRLRGQDRQGGPARAAHGPGHHLPGGERGRRDGRPQLAPRPGQQHDNGGPPRAHHRDRADERDPALHKRAQVDHVRPRVVPHALRQLRGGAARRADAGLGAVQGRGRGGRRLTARAAAVAALSAAAVLLLCGCPPAPAQSVPPSSAPAYAERGGGARDGDSGSATAPQGQPGARAADGGSCRDGSECESGVCEGEGCGVNKPGRCVAASRACAGGEEIFCGCGERTFRAPADCPGQRYSRRGACAESAPQSGLPESPSTTTTTAP